MKTILGVEDSGTRRDLTAHFLHQGGFRVLEAEDGEQTPGEAGIICVKMVTFFYS